jgi:hypothetical protein
MYYVDKTAAIFYSNDMPIFSSHFSCYLKILGDDGVLRIPFATIRPEKPLLEPETGLPDVFFKPKNPNLGTNWRALEWKTL